MDWLTNTPSHGKRDGVFIALKKSTGLYADPYKTTGNPYVKVKTKLYQWYRK